jgi:ATP-binding cassette, subfamily B, multidrug efflux pump
MKHLRRSLVFLNSSSWIMVAAVISLIIVLLANLLSPRLLQQTIDDGIYPRNFDVILASVSGLIGLAAVRGIFSFLQTYLSERASQNAAFEMRNTIFNKISELSFSYQDQAQTGELMTRVTSDVDVVRQFIGQAVLNLISSVLTVIGVIGLLISLNWQLALVELAAIPIIFALIGFFISKVRPLFGLAQQRLSGLNTILQENLAGIRVVRAFAREPYESRRYLQMNTALVDVNIDVSNRASIAFPLSFTTINLATLAVVLVGGIKVIGGELTIGQLVAFLSYLTVLIGPIFGLGFLATFISRAIVSSERIWEILDAKNDVQDKPDAQALGSITGAVSFKNVTFKFAGAEKPALKDVSLDVKPGQTVAIMGKTGSGKSSIINLIPRFYDPQSGQVLIDGVDIRDVTLESLRGGIGIVLQDTILFSGSIRENIAYGRPEASLEEVQAAARAAQAHAFISEFPDGYDTVVGERGVGLSGGQKQRIAIARALLLNPRILILDDSTSAVDAETEFQLQQALDRLMKDRTSFVIAQRISTVRDADVIVLLDGGRIVATGTHNDLLASSALYGDIVDSQLKRDDASSSTPRGAQAQGVPA